MTLTAPSPAVLARKPRRLSEPRWVLVTPELAREWLALNVNNRHLDQVKVSEYAEDMRTGRWTPESAALIQRGPDGELHNGQHRCQAVIESNTPTWMLVLDMTAKLNMDNGRTRSFGDHVRMLGRPNANLLASLVRWVHLWERGERMSLSGINHVSYSIRQEALDAHPELADSVLFASRKRFPGFQPSVMAMAHWVFSSIDPDECEEFLSRVHDGIQLDADHPAYALRQRVTTDRLNRRRVSQAESLALTIIAWNAFRERRSITRLVLPKGGLRTSNYPVPI